MTIDLFEKEDKKLIARCKAIAARIKAEERDKRKRWEPTLKITYISPESLQQSPAPQIPIKKRVRVTGKPELEIVKPAPAPDPKVLDNHPAIQQKQPAPTPKPAKAGSQRQRKPASTTPTPATLRNAAPLWATVERWKEAGSRGTLAQLCTQSGVEPCFLGRVHNRELRKQLKDAIDHLPFAQQNPQGSGRKKDPAPLWATIERWKEAGMRGSLEQLCTESGFGAAFLRRDSNRELKDKMMQAIEHLPWNPDKVQIGRNARKDRG